MPDVLVEVRGDWLRSARVRANFLEAIHSAMVESLQIPVHDRVIRFIAHEEENFLIPGNRGPRYTRIEIVMFAGRSMDAKRKLYSLIVANLARFDVPGDDVKIILIEVEKHNWGIRGGRPGNEVDLGFKVEV